MQQYVEIRHWFNLCLNLVFFCRIFYVFRYGIPERGPRVFNCKCPRVCPCFMHKVIIAVPSIVIVDVHISLK